MSYNNSGNRGDRPNSGVLFTNDRKQTDKQPDMTGFLVFDVDVIEALVKGHRAGIPMKLQMSAWMGRSNRGTDYLSIRFGARDAEINRGQPGQGPAPQAVSPQTYAQASGGQMPQRASLSTMMPRSPAPAPRQPSAPVSDSNLDLEDKLPF